MPVERRERVIAIRLGSTGNGRNPMFNGRRQPSRGGTSRMMMREYQVRFCERLGVKFPGLLGIHVGLMRPTGSWHVRCAASCVLLKPRITPYHIVGNAVLCITAFWPNQLPQWVIRVEGSRGPPSMHFRCHFET
jgi:hypothetical protein